MTDFLAGLLPRKVQVAFILAAPLVIGALVLWPKKVASAVEVERYTGVHLCPTAHVRDLTTPQERDAVQGFSFHVQLQLDHACSADFERQMLALSLGSCTGKRMGAEGCFMQDVYRSGSKRTSVSAKRRGADQYDVRFYE